MCDDLSVTVTGTPVDIASKQPVTRENIAKRAGKLGDSIFTAENMEISVSEDAFYPLRSINELRREAIVKLENALIEQNGFPVRRENALPELAETKDNAKNFSHDVMSLDAANHTDNIQCVENRKYVVSENTKLKSTGRLYLSIRRTEQLQAVYDLICRKRSALLCRLYLDSRLFESKQETILSICRELSKYCELVIALPYIIREKDMSFLENQIFQLFSAQEKSGQNKIFCGVQVRSPEGMGIVRVLLKNNEYHGKIYTDAGLYIWNIATLNEWKNSELQMDEFCLPLELKGAEQRSLLQKEIPCEKVIYGRAPMMLTANCVANTTSGCRKGSGEQTVQLVDRYHKSFPVELNCRQCMNIIYNSVPLSLHGEVSKWREQADLRLDFTVETAQETESVLEYFMDICSSRESRELAKPPYGEYTTGHEKRGVE